MPESQATLLAKLEANAKRQKEVNALAAELRATLGTTEPEVVQNVPVDLQERPLPVGTPQR